jgi:guanylate kinase
MKKGDLIIISGPSGVGKTTTVAHLLKEFLMIHRIVTATTRPPREGERNGRDYHFLSKEVFDELDKAACFLETNHFANASYATMRSTLNFLRQGTPCVLITDINGAATILESIPDAVTIWLDAPIEILRRRLYNRSTETMDEREERIQLARFERKQAKTSDIYKHVIDMTSVEQGENDLFELIETYINPPLVPL